MKISVWLCAVLAFLASPDVSGQWSDHFNYGALSDNVAWQGDVAHFAIANGILQLNAPGAGRSAIYRGIQPDANFILVWEFSIELGFSPSNNNFARVFLAAENPLFFDGDSPAGAPAYYLRFGENGSNDAVELFRIDTGSDAPVSICRGIEGGVAAPFAHKYRIIYDNGQWTIFSGNWGSPYYYFETEGNDTMAFASNYFGLQFQYTASNTGNFFIDDLLTGIFVPDGTAPAVTEIAASDAWTLMVGFSEAVDSTALQPDNYHLQPDGNSVVATGFTSTSQTGVMLAWENDFPAGEPFVLTIDTLRDIAGNFAAGIQTVLMWDPPPEADSAQILINEVFPDPSPVVGLPEAEFIELVNLSPDTLNLEGYILYNSAIPLPLRSFDFPPGAYLILCAQADTLLFEPYGYVMGTDNWPALVNSSDSITLVSASGTVIDALKYDSGWYGDEEKDDGGWSLERIRYHWPCEAGANWTASVNPAGGTPGMQNSIFDNTPDTAAPAITSLIVTSPDGIRFNLTEMPATGPLQPGQIDIQGLEPLLIEYGEDPLENLVLRLAEPMEENTVYSIKLAGVSDCAGNVSTDILEFYSGFFPAPGDILFNELMPDPTPPRLLPETEFIELFNKTPHPFYLENWQLDNSGNRKPIPPIHMQPYEYRILCKAQDTAMFLGFGRVTGLESWIALANSGDSLTLLNEKGEPVAGVKYDVSWYRDDNPDISGRSLERIDISTACNGKANWAASGNTAGGTPGAANQPSAGLLPGDVLLKQAFFGREMRIITVFSGEPDTASLPAVVVEITPGNTLTYEGHLLTDEGFTAIFAPGFSPEEDTVYRLRVSELKTCTGSFAEVQEIEFGIPSPAQKGDLVINEILFNPFTGGSDFIELLNISEGFINLQGWRISETDETGTGQESILSKQPLLIGPGKVMAFSRVPEELPLFYPAGAEKRNLFQTSLPNFNNSAGAVVLRDPQLQTADSMAFDEQMHFSLISDVNGVSLERIFPEGPSADPQSWASAAQSAGFATPGRPNSQLFRPTPGGTVSLEPELFSPDNDGFNDRLHIVYRLPSGGWTGNITIYSDAGLRVRRLAAGEWLGSEGVVAWDGTDDAGNRSPVGIYIVYFEIFNAQGEKQVFRKTCVLGAKL